jgi:hypothetical protein
MHYLGLIARNPQDFEQLLLLQFLLPLKSQIELIVLIISKEQANIQQIVMI